MPSSDPVTATTGRPAAASSSSRSRVTPGRRLAKADAPHTWHTGGRTVPHRRQASRPSSPSPTAASHTSQRTSDRHERQASTRARPGVLCTQTTVRSGSRRWRISAEVTSDVFQGSSRVRSTTSTIGQAARSSTVGTRTRFRPTAASPTTVGHGDVSRTGTPDRRARSTTTSRACHVGLRSSCRASSCSSTTTAAARPGHGAHAASRAPITTSTPPAARAQSCGTTATVSPARRRRAASRRARSIEGTTASTGPRRVAAAMTGTTSSVGGSRRTAASPSKARAASGWIGATWRPLVAGAGNPATFVGGDAATRNGRRRPAAQRIDAQWASSISSAGGPRELTLASGRSRSASTPAAGGSSSTTQPPTRRPCRGTRTRTPSATRSASSAGTL